MKCLNCGHEIYEDLRYKRLWHNINVYKEDKTSNYHDEICNCNDPQSK